MMSEMKVLDKSSCCPARAPAQKSSIFATRPFAPPVEEHEAPVGGSRLDFSFADISILPRETVQPKLRLGPVGDRYEQEADRVARRVVQTISSSEQESVQREVDLEDEEELDLEEEELRRKVAVSSAAGGADVGPDLESAIHRARGRGQPLSDGVRQPMERAFGVDFGGVRVHADGEADSLNRSIQARAFTAGQDIFLRQGEFRPGSFEGQRLLAHELTHVVQQNEGAVMREIFIDETEEQVIREVLDSEPYRTVAEILANNKIIDLFVETVDTVSGGAAQGGTLLTKINEQEVPAGPITSATLNVLRNAGKFTIRMRLKRDRQGDMMATLMHELTLHILPIIYHINEFRRGEQGNIHIEQVFAGGKRQHSDMERMKMYLDNAVLVGKTLKDRNDPQSKRTGSDIIISAVNDVMTHTNPELHGTEDDLAPHMSINNKKLLFKIADDLGKEEDLYRESLQELFPESSESSDEEETMSEEGELASY